MSTVVRVVAVLAGLAVVAGGIALLARDDGAQVGVLVLGAGAALAWLGTRPPVPGCADDVVPT